jgi:hypothetical protein
MTAAIIGAGPWSQKDATPRFPVGIIAEDPETGFRYRYMKFDNGVGNVAAVSGNFAYVLAVSGASAGQSTTVTMDLTDCAGVGAGVFQSVPADGDYCWLQISGIATLTTALTAGADGNALTPVGAGADGTLDVSAAVTDHICAIALDASAKIVLLCNMG